MSAPKLPGHTCPLIDKIQQAIDRAFTLADRIIGSDDLAELQAAIKDIRWELNGESDKLEQIRDANLTLRNAAEYWKEEAEKLAEC